MDYDRAAVFKGRQEPALAPRESSICQVADWLEPEALGLPRFRGRFNLL